MYNVIQIVIPVEMALVIPSAERANIIVLKIAVLAVKMSVAFQDK
jgi:hypothetical protein